jgi:hypothetical protein
MKGRITMTMEEKIKEERSFKNGKKRNEWTI